VGIWALSQPEASCSGSLLVLGCTFLHSPGCYAFLSPALTEKGLQWSCKQQLPICPGMVGGEIPFGSQGLVSPSDTGWQR
jgi:hypothetical protein